MSRAAFISHSSDDKEIAGQICNFLESHGVPCWIAPRDVTPGKNYGAAIVEAIDECKIFVLVLSAASNQSSQVVREVERAANANSVIIPFRITPVDPSHNLAFYVSAAHWLDASNKTFDKHLPELLRAIESWQKQNAAATEKPAVSSTSSAAIAKAPRASRSSVPIIMAAAVIAIGLAGYFFLRKEAPPKSAPAVMSTPLSVASAPSASVALATATPGTMTVPNVTTAETRAQRRRQNDPFRLPTATEPPVASVAGAGSPAFKESVKLQPEESPTSAGPILANQLPSSTAPAIPAAGLSAPATTVPVVSKVTATSEQHVTGQVHSPEMAFDGNPATTWLPQTEGIGQSITARFQSPARLTSVSILNGNGANQSRYDASNRIRALRMTFSDGTTQTVTCDERMAMQRFKLDRPIVTEWVKFEILSIWPGTKFHHTPVAEIAFNVESSGQPAPESSEHPESGFRRRRAPSPKPGS